MGFFRRVWLILTSLITILLSLLLACSPEDSCYLILGMLGSTLLFYGIQQLFYFTSMARFKIGGRISLYIGIICLDLAFLTFGISEVRPQVVMLYLLLYYIFYGVIRIYSALEAKRLGAKSWRTKLGSGIVCLIISCLCVFNFSSVNAMVYILCFGLVYSSVVQIILACRKTAIIYIQ